tara:strand:- start:95 stop:547 length:453 start_codon:yes stop_codon:yes gene_type:complete
MKTKVKIGKVELTFTGDDIFFDSGDCVVCLTKYGHRAKQTQASHLTITAKHMSKLEVDCERIQQPNYYGTDCDVYKLKQLGTKLATHKHFRISGYYRIRERSIAWPSVSLRIVRDLVDFWDVEHDKWIQSNAVKVPDLIELTAAEKEALK